MIVGTIISAGKTVMASEYKDRATVEMGKKVNFTSVFKEQLQRKSDKVVKLIYHFHLIFDSLKTFLQGSTLTLILAEEEDAGVYQCR